MRNAASPLFAVALITAFVACANGSSDDPSTDVNGTDPDSGVSTKPASNGGGNNGGDNNANGVDSGGGGGNTGKDSGSGGGGTDSGGGGTDSGGGGTSVDQCDTSPNTLAGAAYTVAYTKLADPTLVPCPCLVGQCCYDNHVWPAACIKK